jgi:hypothetical protein
MVSARRQNIKLSASGWQFINVAHSQLGRSEWSFSASAASSKYLFVCVIVFFDDFGENVSGDAVFGGKLV